MTETLSTETDPREAAKRKAKTMIVWTVGVLTAVVVLFVVFSQSLFLEFRLSVLLKLGAGVLGTILLSAGLMAAAFYSDASGHDDDAPSA
ncbi:MAG: hypothetical protein AAF225_05370 [Pseudomonadota bacterium]